MDLGVQGMVFLVAGASKGLGHAIARCLAAEGAGVAIASRDAQGIEWLGGNGRYDPRWLWDRE